MVLPLGDDNRDRMRWPIVTFVLVVVNVLVFFYELTLDSGSRGGGSSLQGFIFQYGVVPREYASGQDLDPTIGFPYWITLVTSMFLHGGWGHLLFNMLFLWIFGDNVEDRFGHVWFVIFYFATGIAGGVAQIFQDPRSLVPAVGASGAISGVLGAYIVLFPHKRVRVLLGWFVTEMPAILVIGMWAATQFLNGFGTVARTEETGGGVAYMAHIGGFVAGVLAGLVGRAVGGGRPPRGRLRVQPYDFR